ncbi:MAG: PrsW family intramembrane metalloprotease [Bacteroidota bacterium]|nr:PrsW family intramembrane metalloprotease [Bacteroidota bacterium]
MIFVYLVLGILLIGFVNFLILKFKKDKKLNRKFYDFNDGNFIVYAVVVLIVAFVTLNFTLKEPEFSSADEQLDYGTKTAQPWLVSQAYRERVEKDSLNIENHFHLVDMHFNEFQYDGPDIRLYNREEHFIYVYYSKLAASTDPAKADLGNLFLGIFYYHKGEFVFAEKSLKQIKDTTLKYMNNYLGMVNYYFRRADEAKENLDREIKLNGYLEGAYYNLSRIYSFENNAEKMKQLVYNPISKPFIPYTLRKEVYIQNKDVGSYFKDRLAEIFKNTNFIGFAGAFLILVIWIMYLLRVNIHRSKNLFGVCSIVLLSALFVFPVWLLYDFYKYALHFELTGGIINDAFYCIFGIGVIEELVKIIPFLLVLRFTKVIKEPIDYIMYASLSALGFAFVENFMYFRDGSLNIMHTRALTASIAHMIFSSIIAYGLILAKFKYKKNSVTFFVLFFLIAAFAHGFYDFWLLNKVVSDYWIMTFLCLLVAVQVYASFINNALNNPTSLNTNVQLNTMRLASDLAAALVFVFIFEYVCLAFIYGPTIGNRELISSMLGGGYMILFLSIRLSNIDIFPGDWARLNFLVGLMPASIIYGGKKPNYNAALGTQLRIRTFRKGKLDDVLPLEGEIISREKISGFTGWFLVKLKTKMPYVKLNNDFVLIRSKNPVELLGHDEGTIIYFTTIPDITAFEKPVKNDADFKFMDWAVATAVKI